MIKETKYFLTNNSSLILFFLKKPDKTKLNLIKFKFNNNIKPEIRKNSNINYLDFIKTNKEKTNKKDVERFLKEIIFIPKLNKDNLLHNICSNNKIIFIEGIRAWKKYGALRNTYSYALFDEIVKIHINDNFFFSQEKSSNILNNILKSKIKRIGENENYIGSAVLCSLFFNRELDKMISVSVGNILYSILRERSRQKYEIIYTSKEQYHDINTPYQLSPFNQDYNYLDIKYHNININDIIIIANNKQNIEKFLDKINSKEDNLLNNVYFNIDNSDNYLAEFKIIKQQMALTNDENLNISSTSSSS